MSTLLVPGLVALLQVSATQDEELTPRRAMELLEETHRLMRQAEERLNEARPEKAEKHEQGAADRLAELIRKARSSDGRSAQASKRTRNAASQRDPRSADPTRQSYDPKRIEEPSRFRSSGAAGSWGRLPPAVRGVLLESAREEVPPEFQETWRRYRDSLEGHVR
jgi:septal ring factor EnvC (AmiA/AmiB activator)